MLDPSARASVVSWGKRLTTELTAVVSALAAEVNGDGAAVTGTGTGTGASADGGGGPGPCLLALLESDLAGRLGNDCMPNHPLGARLPAVQFYATLLTEVQSQHILLHQGLMAPISQAVRTFAEQPAEPTDPEMPYRIALLCELCDRLVQEPSLLPVFMGAPSSSSSSSSASASATTSQGYRKSASKAGPSQFWLLAALIPHIYLEGDAGGRVRQAILQCVKLSRSHKQARAPENTCYTKRTKNFAERTRGH